MSIPAPQGPWQTKQAQGRHRLLPRAEFHRYLRMLVEAGFGKRIMFGSDQMISLSAIEVAIESVETADFLTEEQRRGILNENAARFLRLSRRTESKTTVYSHP